MEEHKEANSSPPGHQPMKGRSSPGTIAISPLATPACGLMHAHGSKAFTSAFFEVTPTHTDPGGISDEVYALSDPSGCVRHRHVLIYAAVQMSSLSVWY